MTTDDDHHEQELRRLKECIEETEEEEDKKYNQIQFNYNRLEQNDKSEDLNSNGNNEFNNEEDAFRLPDNLSLPVNLQQPSTMKEHNLIEKTAKFIGKQGGQMEILLKTKQPNNPQFNF